jgi:hypothetical protein
MQKAGIRWAGCSGGNTEQLQPTPASLLYTATNKEWDREVRMATVPGEA